MMHKKQNLPELTLRGLVLGSILTIIFTASNVYLGLKVGLTFSSSIPAVVISMAVLSLFKTSNILENNMVQTQASAAGTLSSVIFVIPGLFMCGYWSEFPLWQTFMICLCGGGLGVLFTIPLRRTMVVESKLAYPEGRAAAEILKVANKDQSSKKGKQGIKEIALGSFIAAIFSLLSNGFKLAASESNFAFIWNKMAFGFSMGYSLALLGAGYLVGLAGAIALFVGMFLAWGIFTPYLSNFEFDSAKNAVDLASSVWSSKVRLIGTGAIAIAALWTLIELLKPVIEGIKEIVKNVKITNQEKNERTNIDLSLKSIFILFVLMVVGLFITFYSFVEDANLSIYYQMLFSFVGTLVSVLIGFFVAAACGYMAGLVGSSSSPISGIGLIGVIISSIVFLVLGVELFQDPMLSKFAVALAIFTTSVILATAAISNDNLQDLKTGHLVGATPWKQQVALLVGCVFGALAIVPVLNLLYQAYGFVGAMPREGMDASSALAAPQANLMSTIAQGIFHHNIEWGYMAFGVFVGILMIIIDKILKGTQKMSLPPLAVGIGIYLPPAVNIPLVIGGILKYIVMQHLTKKYAKNSHKEEKLASCEQRGTLFASGLIVGESIFGVIIAGITVFSVSMGGSENPLALNLANFHDSELFALIFFVGVVLYFIKRIVKKDA
ncbi:oligopeptide transporter, OPT family [Campylobacter sp. CFSAN093239]|uniref:OPT family oligopeptide transporter n=1 Tax=unclassified Campylobacter TaxID=2593542 RepID=UPI0013EF50C0|nr:MULTISPECIES: oligopeptide transporter, OPT family [unclassified Campylobacter]ELB8243409.1 oligopeptide transporter, OPT family [Campylobacter jejuni]MDV6202211.1 oligopeptide transporter, OPT family [Campylobacter jejuni]NGY14710.1 oligopeptide transporter, OPT family [Campylobacter sp. CFSAN093261]NGY30338.1 oligopeptide transporter, OPT family [Campylobacter sp. CFSAN093239]QJE50844.1 oligopeptide transporter, OPT family [Campylobacter sp. CFSAN093238]